MEKNITKKNVSRKSLIEKRLKYLEENKDYDASYLDVTMGPMFSAKTSHLLSIIESAGKVGRVLYINHLSDSRNSTSAISTHSKSRDIQKLVSEMNGEAVKLQRLKDYPIERLINEDGTLKFESVTVDEAQFFPDLKKTITFFVDVLNIPFVYVAGLDGSAKRKKFGQITDLIHDADSYTKLKNARCEVCAKNKKHKLALFSHKIDGSNKNTIDVGGADKYVPLCRKCWNSLNKL